MNQDNATILIVEDEPTQLEFHKIILENQGYRTICAENGNQAFELITASPEKVDVIVSDVLMPELDGYELCKKLKASGDDNINSIPVIFVSSLTDLNEKLRGYAAGGDDYVPKPIEPEIFVEKLKNVIQIRKKNHALKSQLNESFNTAIQAMTYSSELGRILEFFSESLRTESYEELVQSLFRVTDSYGLNAAVQIYLPESILNYSNTGAFSPLEANIMELARHKARFYDFGARTLINYKDFSLLIKNMPLDNPERYGRLKDTLGSLCNAVEAKITDLMRNNRAEQIQEILAALQNAMSGIDSAFQNIQKQNVAAIENMRSDIEEAMLHLGLLEYQEENILGISQRCLDQTKEVFFQGIELNKQFDYIQQKLKRILSK